MMLAGNKLGDAGHRVVIEEFLEGEEASFIVMVDGHARAAARHRRRTTSALRRRRGPEHRRHGRLLAGAGGDARSSRARHARDHHADRARHGRRGRALHRLSLRRAHDRRAGRPSVVEFNCRFGDPETQPIMMRLKSDLLDLVDHAIDGHAADRSRPNGIAAPRWASCWPPRAIPDTPRKGDVIIGLPRSEHDLHVFHAGTALKDGTRGHQRRARAVRHGPGRQGADGAPSAPTRRRRRSTSRACSTAATSGTAPSGGADGSGRRPRLPPRPAGAHRRAPRGARRQALSSATSGSAPRAAAG